MAGMSHLWSMRVSREYNDTLRPAERLPVCCRWEWDASRWRQALPEVIARHAMDSRKRPAERRATLGTGTEALSRAVVPTVPRSRQPATAITVTQCPCGPSRTSQHHWSGSGSSCAASIAILVLRNTSRGLDGALRSLAVFLQASRIFLRASKMTDFHRSNFTHDRSAGAT